MTVADSVSMGTVTVVIVMMTRGVRHSAACMWASKFPGNGGDINIDVAAKRMMMKRRIVSMVIEVVAIAVVVVMMSGSRG